MSQYGWHNCPDAIRAQVEGFTAKIVNILGDNLSGVYLHGSLAMDCFNPTRSDIDLLVVTRQGMSHDTLRRIARVVLQYAGNPRPFELSFVRDSYLHPWQYPTPFDFHYGDEWGEKIQTAIDAPEWSLWVSDPPPTDPDLAAHITITRARGICLAGKPVAEVFPDVRRADYLDSIMADFEFARNLLADNPIYAILNFCRIYAYLRDNIITSKDEAGVWALAHLPADYHPLIHAALDTYRNNTPHTFNLAALTAFADYMEVQSRKYLS
jgi:predicted nucleotidyltransferase